MILSESEVVMADAKKREQQDGRWRRKYRYERLLLRRNGIPLRCLCELVQQRELIGVQDRGRRRGSRIWR